MPLLIPGTRIPQRRTDNIQIPASATARDLEKFSKVPYSHKAGIIRLLKSCAGPSLSPHAAHTARPDEWLSFIYPVLNQRLRIPRSSQSMTEDDLLILDFWQTGYKSLHYSNVPSQRPGHHPRTRISLPSCLKFKNASSKQTGLHRTMFRSTRF